MWIDSHCHLTHSNIKEAGSPHELISRAHHAGIDGMLLISCQIKGDFPDVLAVAQSHQNVWCSIGTHPHDAGDADEAALSEDDLVKLAQSDPNIIGIGESGLDYYYTHSPVQAQKDSFRKHIRACIRTNLPLIVHARDADEDMAQILREEGEGTGLRGVMHCFSSGPDLAKAALDLGFYISFSGIVTFKKAVELQEIAKTVPLDRILVETDAPYLAPHPHRGKINEPALLIYTGRKLAELHGIPEARMAEQTTANFFTLFNQAKLS